MKKHFSDDDILDEVDDIEFKNKIINPAKIVVEIDCGNTCMQKEEKIEIEQAIRKTIEKMSMKIEKLRIYHG